MTQPNPYAVPPMPTRGDEVEVIWQCVRRTLEHARRAMAWRLDSPGVDVIRREVIDFLLEAERDSVRHDYVYRDLRSMLLVRETVPGTIRVTLEPLPAEDGSGQRMRAEVSHAYYLQTEERADEPAPSCSPTYALSHRWGWPDARGFMICVCGAASRTSSETIACHVHAPGISTPLHAAHLYEGLSIPRDPVEAERQRCERLGVEWVGPDVQGGPVALQVLAQVVPSFPIREDMPVGELVRLGCELREADGVTPVR